jgi:hypothetical protein
LRGLSANVSGSRIARRADISPAPQPFQNFDGFVRVIFAGVSDAAAIGESKDSPFGLGPLPKGINDDLFRSLLSLFAGHEMVVGRAGRGGALPKNRGPK